MKVVGPIGQEGTNDVAATSATRLVRAQQDRSHGELPAVPEEHPLSPENTRTSQQPKRSNKNWCRPNRKSLDNIRLGRLAIVFWAVCSSVIKSKNVQGWHVEDYLLFFDDKNQVLLGGIHQLMMKRCRSCTYPRTTNSVTGCPDYTVVIRRQYRKSSSSSSSRDMPCVTRYR